MSLILLFFCGIANFALHRAVLESNHPMLPRGVGRFTLPFEFVLLVAAMSMTDNGAFGWAWGYGLYTALNLLGTWMLLSRRL